MCFSTSDDMNIRQNSLMSVFLHLMILTSDKIQRYFFSVSDDIKPKKAAIIEFCLMLNIIGALWVGYRIDPLPCQACRKRRLRQEQLARRIKGLA